MRKYVNREAVEEAMFAKWEKERRHWIEYLKQYRATKEYSSKEQSVDNWLRGYGEAVEDFLAIVENTPAAEVVPVVTDTNVGGKWIPVTERLPEEPGGEYYETVIIAKSNGKVTVGCYRNRDREWWGDVVDGAYSDITSLVTHWMPLPEPPEAEKGGE